MTTLISTRPHRTRDTDPGLRVNSRRRTWPVLLGAGLIYLALGFILWINAWADGAPTHTLCGCGDPALFLWFFQWPATALAHGHNPFYSTALFHPGGINLLAQTSVTGLSLPLVPVTWIWGPVASLNVASTLTPALTAFFAFVVIRRWAPWTPAAFVGGLLYGFSPFVLTSLEFGHLMTAALMLLPLILAVLDEILIRQRHSALWSGVALGVLVFAQLFMSSEVLALCAVVTVVSLIVLVVFAAILRPDDLRRRAPHAARGLGVGLVVGGMLLAWPVWFALDGPAHLSGLLWKNLPLIGGVRAANFVSSSTPTGGASLYLTLGGYEGTPLGSTVYLGWTLIGVLVVGVAAFWRDKKMWFFGFLLVFCFVLSIGPKRGEWVPASILDKLPLIENVAVQRFMAVGYLAAAVLLALILFHVHELLPDWRGWLGALAVSALALVQIVTVFAPQLPYTMTRVILPRWYATVAPNLPPGRVLLSYPAPFSGIQVSMSWQAVNGIHYSQAGGGGPQGQASFAGERGVRVHRPDQPWLWHRYRAADRDKRRVRRRASCARSLAGDHRRRRDQSGGATASAGSRSDLRRRLHDGGVGSPAHGAGGRMGLERRAGRHAPAAPTGSEHNWRLCRPRRKPQFPDRGRPEGTGVCGAARPRQLRHHLARFVVRLHSRRVDVTTPRFLERWSVVNARLPGSDAAVLHCFDPLGARVVPATMLSLHPNLRRSDSVDSYRAAGSKRTRS